MQEESERIEGEEYEGSAGQVRRSRATFAKIAALVVALAVVGSSVGVYTILFSNRPPVASFTFDSVDLRLTVNAEASSDPDGNIAKYSWEWGDGSTGTGIRAAHNYSAENTYPVTLTVTDNGGSVGGLGVKTNKTSQTAVIKVFPTAFFIARQDRMNTSFDASGSFVSTKEAITDYTWDFGDGSRGSGARTNHTYVSPGRYVAKLEVTDTKGRKGETTRFVSPADTTVDILMDQFYQGGCPYRQYWLLRKNSYGDSLLQDKVPCTDYYPWVYFSSAVELQKVNPSWVYSVYRFDARVRNHPGYNLSQPVVLPVFDASATTTPKSFIQLNLSFDYMDSPTIDALQKTPFPVNRKYSDGFGYLVQGNITMDLATSKRIFGVAGNVTTQKDAQWWWHNNTGPQPRKPGPLETKYAQWLEDLGNVRPGHPNSGKYDIYNAFEWYYESDITWLNATIGPDGTTKVQVFFDGWGYDVLLSRWWYWGNASYRNAVCVKGDYPECTATLDYGAIQPRGWMPMETCWCEQTAINGRITSALDLDLVAYQEYSYQAWGNAGRDKILGTKDDLPAWVWAPYDMDYVPRQNSGSPAAEGYPDSELRWYEGTTTVIGSPGGYGYGQPYEYTLAPIQWRLNPGSSLTIVMPSFPVPWYDPVKSKWNATAKIGDYATFESPLTLRYICKSYGDASSCNNSPGGADTFYLWDKRAKTFSFAGPYDWGSTGMPVQPSPWIEFAPEEQGG